MRWILLAALLLALGAGSLYIYSGPTPRLTFGDEQGEERAGVVPSTIAAFSPDGKLIVAGGKNNVLRLWDTQTGKSIRQFRCHQEKGTQLISEVRFSPDGRHVLACGQDRDLCMWEVETGKLVRCFAGANGASIDNFVLSPDGVHAIATGTTLRELRLWDLKSGKLLKEEKWPGAEQVGAIYFNKPGTRLLLTGYEISVWDFAELKKRQSSSPIGNQRGLRPPPQMATFGALFHPDGQSILFCDRFGKIIQRHLESGEEKATYDLKVQNVYSLVFNSKGNRLLVGSSVDGVARLYSFPECEILQTIHGHGRIQISPDGGSALTFTRNGRMMLWDLNK